MRNRNVKPFVERRKDCKGLALRVSTMEDLVTDCGHRLGKLEISPNDVEYLHQQIRDVNARMNRAGYLIDAISEGKAIGDSGFPLGFVVAFCLVAFLIGLRVGCEA